MKGVIFDLFATLVSAQDPETWMIKTFNLPFDRSYVQKVACATIFENWDQYMQVLIEKLNLSESDIPKLRARFQHERDTTFLLPGVLEILRDLKSKGYKIALITNLLNPDYDMTTKFDFKFDAITLSYELGAVKPDKSLFLDCLKKLNLDASEVIMVGDNLLADIKGSEAVGIKGILFDPEGKNPSYPNRIEKFSELLTQFTNLK